MRAAYQKQLRAAMKNFRNYDPIWMGILTGLAALILWYFSSLAIDKSITPTADKIWPFFSAGVGAFCGSYFAYLFRKHEERQAKLSKRKSTLDACVFALFRQYNAMFQMKKIFDQHETDIERAFSMRAMKFPEYKNIQIDFESLNFLSEHNELNHLLSLTIEQERFEQTIVSMEIRNSFHVETLQPALEKLNLNGRELLIDEFERLLGPLIFNTAIGSSKTTYDLLCQNLDSNHEAHQKTWNIAKKIFPDKEFLSPAKHHPAKK